MKEEVAKKLNEYGKGEGMSMIERNWGESIYKEINEKMERIEEAIK